MNTTHFSNFEALRLITLALILCQGCDRSDSGDLYTAETTGTGGTIPSTTTDGGRGETSGARGTTGPDTTTGETSGGSADPLGELTDRGTVELPQDTLDPPICNDVCDSLGGTCTDAAAGYSYYDCQSESHGGNFYTCGYAEPAQYENDNVEVQIRECFHIVWRKPSLNL